MKIKLPLPFKGAVCFTNNLDYVISTTDQGELELFKISSNTRETIESHLKGKGKLVKLSGNEQWLVSGIYTKGIFQIFKVTRK